MEKEVERFECEAKSGARSTVVAFQEYIAFNPLNGPTQWVKGLKRLELADGSSFVNCIDEQTYKIVTTDEIVRRL